MLWPQPAAIQTGQKLTQLCLILRIYSLTLRLLLGARLYIRPSRLLLYLPVADLNLSCRKLRQTTFNLNKPRIAIHPIEMSKVGSFP